MSEIVTLARREVEERKLLLFGGVLVGLFSPLIALWARAELELVAVPISLAAANGVAVVVGATMVNSELLGGRLSFYFSRPVKAASVWWGKLLGGVALCLSVQLVSLLPAILIAPGRFLAPVADHMWIWLASLPVPLLVLTLAHTLSAIVHQRSAWLAVDLIAALAVGGTLWAVRSLIRRVPLPGSMSIWIAAVIGACLVAGLGAGAIQIARGRTERGLGHRWMSIVLWGVLAVTAVALAGMTRWAVAMPPSASQVLPSGRDSLAGPFVSTQAYSFSRSGFGLPKPRSGYQTQYLYHLDEEPSAAARWWRLKTSPLRPTYSQRGQRVLWSDSEWVTGSWQHRALWLDRQELPRRSGGSLRRHARESPLPLGSTAIAWALSPDGESLAWVEDPGRLGRSDSPRTLRVQVGRVESAAVTFRAMLGASELGGLLTNGSSYEIEPVWLGALRLRLYIFGVLDLAVERSAVGARDLRPALTIVELDVGAGEVVSTATIARIFPSRMTLSWDLDRLLLSRTGEISWHSGAGEWISTLELGEGETSMATGFVGDRAVMLLGGPEGKVELLSLTLIEGDADTETPGRIEVTERLPVPAEPGPYASIGSEYEAGKVLLSLRGSQPRVSKLLRYDATQSQITVLEDLSIDGPWSFPLRLRPLHSWRHSEPGSMAGLLVASDFEVLRYDPLNNVLVSLSRPTGDLWSPYLPDEHWPSGR